MPINPLSPSPFPYPFLLISDALLFSGYRWFAYQFYPLVVENHWQTREKAMQGFKLKTRKVLRKVLSFDNLEVEYKNSPKASRENLGLKRTSSSSNRHLSYHQDTKNRIFIGSWNVGGVAPPEDLDMEDWLDRENDSADIYVLGFQEIVPLNAANVLGPKNREISKKWNSLIGAALNKRIPVRLVQEDKLGEPHKVYPIKDRSCAESEHGEDFQCIITRRMVGMFMTIWVRSDLDQHIRHLSVSNVSCGVMGCLGNKDSISIRFFLHETSFCFVCSHLASGGKEVDQRQRNTNAANILSYTSFPVGPLKDLPQKILDHGRVIWLGDLNYRICMPDSATQSLVKRREWDILLKNDQLKTELMEDHVFEGWHEGGIEFPPTYKYHPNSEDYVGYDQPCVSKTRRAPAWCDRIIWFGKGMKQTQYSRGESTLSDHRPVRAMFTADITVFGN